MKKFNLEILHSLQKELNLKNIWAVPRVQKIVISVGTGRSKDDKDLIKKISSDLEKITGQKPRLNKSKKSVSAFKLRIGQPVGLTVTLRGRRMYDFLTKVINVTMPRIRDFKGLTKKSFDGRGNLSIGIEEHIIMPEIKYDSVNQTFGLQVNIQTTAENDEQGYILLKSLGFPFEKEIKG